MSRLLTTKKSVVRMCLYKYAATHYHIMNWLRVLKKTLNKCAQQISQFLSKQKKKKVKTEGSLDPPARQCPAASSQPLVLTLKAPFVVSMVVVMKSCVKN